MIDKLKQYGADVDAAMTRMLDDEEFYIECIGILLNDENFNLLSTALKQGDYKMAFECAHTLKGVTANLELTPLLIKIKNITELLRQKETANYSKLYDDIMNETKKLKKIIG